MFSFTFNEKDSPEFEIIRSIIIRISDILEYQLCSEIGNAWLPYNTTISVSFYCSESIQTFQPFYNNLRLISGNLGVGEISVREQPKSTVKEYYFRKEFDPDQFRDLASAEIDADEGIPFAIPMHDTRLISSDRKQDIRDTLLNMYYEGLKEVSKFVNVDLSVLKSAYETTKSQSWFIEQSIGEIVSSTGKIPSKAQLIARWEPDYLFHSARIFEEDGSTRDVLFMIYWRLISKDFFNNPGRLSWINKNTLKFIPKHQDEYRFVFDINKGPIDFSYYFDPPRCRATKFYDHLLEDNEPYERKVLYLN